MSLVSAESSFAGCHLCGLITVDIRGHKGSLRCRTVRAERLMFRSGWVRKDHTTSILSPRLVPVQRRPTAYTTSRSPAKPLVALYSEWIPVWCYLAAINPVNPRKHDREYTSQKLRELVRNPQERVLFVTETLLSNVRATLLPVVVEACNSYLSNPDYVPQDDEFRALGLA